MVIWITGLSCAGKSTIARHVVEALKERGQAAILLDGDEVRAAIADPSAKHDRDSRLTNAFRISRLAKLIASQGVPVVVATMSLFREVYKWNRENLPGYFMVFVSVELETLRKEHRDVRGLYRSVHAGETKHVVGVDIEYDVPDEADLVLSNNRLRRSFRPLASKIITAVDLTTRKTKS